MIVLDSTLREGEQTPNVSFTFEEKLNIAKMLDEFGVEMIELGHPSVSPELERTVRELAKEGLKAETLAHVRAVRSDIDKALSCETDRLVIFLPTSGIHIRDKLKMTPDQVLSRIEEEVSYAVDHGAKVRYTPEDATRTDPDFLIEACQVAANAGADRISIADTVGIATPTKFAQIVDMVHQQIDAKIDVHCHNDLGLALANALAALEVGADCVHTTVNGIGERCGIVDLASLTTADAVLNDGNNYRLEILQELSSYVAQAAQFPVSYNAPVIGNYAFTHKSGVHTDGVLKNAQTYEGYHPSLVGRSRQISIDKYTGKLAVSDYLNRNNIEIENDTLQKIIEEIKVYGDQNKVFDDESLMNLVQIVIGGTR